MRKQFLLSIGLLCLLACSCSSQDQQSGHTSTYTPSYESEVFYRFDLKESLLLTENESVDLNDLIEYENGCSFNDLSVSVTEGKAVATLNGSSLTRNAYGTATVSLSLKSDPSFQKFLSVVFFPKGYKEAVYSGQFPDPIDEGKTPSLVALELKANDQFLLTVSEGTTGIVGKDYTVASSSYEGSFAIGINDVTKDAELILSGEEEHVSMTASFLFDDKGVGLSLMIPVNFEGFPIETWPLQLLTE